MRSAAISLVLLACWSAGTPRSARAEAVPLVALPTLLGGYVADRAGWQREFDARIAQAIRKAGRDPRPPGPLTSAEAICRDAECMARIAESLNVGIVIGAKITADRGSPPSYKLVLTRFDRSQPGVVRQEEADCSVCTEVETAERIEQMVQLMVPALVVHAPVPPTAPSPGPAPKPARLSRNALLGIVGATSAVGLAGLVMIGVGGRALAIDGSAATDLQPGASQPRELYDTRGAGIGLVATGSVFLIGAAVGLVFELRALPRRDR